MAVEIGRLSMGVPSRPRLAVGILSLLLAVGALAVLWMLARDGDGSERLDVSWAEQPCTYDAAGGRVDATLVVDYESIHRDTVTVTVSAYADENTSDPVGSASTSVEVHDTLTTTVHLPIAVSAAPHVDEDGVAACRLEVSDRRGLWKR
jgi:hypothetical protein